MDVGKARPRAVPNVWVPVVLTAAGLGVGFVAGVGVGGWQHRDSAAAGTADATGSASATSAPGTPTPDEDLTTTLTAQARLLKFVPVHQPIPQCADFSGTGAIPAGDTLLIFDRAADARGNVVAGSGYDFDGRAASDSPTTWEAKERWIGSGGDGTGHYAQMSAVLVPTGAADFLDSVPGAYRTGWQEAVLRLGSVADTMLVEKGANTHPCPR